MTTPITRSVPYQDWKYDQTDFKLETHQNGIDGTADPTFDVRADGFDYYFSSEGSFLIENYKNGSTSIYDTYYLTSFCYDPNTGTVYAGGMNSGDATLIQWDVPETLSTSDSVDDLPTATLLQDYFSFKDQLTYDDTDDNLESGSMGSGMYMSGGDLYFGTYYGYDTYGVNHDNLVIVRNPSDLSTATFQGYLDMGANDKTTGFIFEIPTEHQADFDGHTHGMGAGNPPSIAGRWPFGHSMYGASLGSIGESDVTGTVTEYMNFGSDNPVSGWSVNVDDVVEHYRKWFGPESSEINDYLNRSDDEKMSFEQVQLLPKPELTAYNNCSGWEVYARGAFIPNNSNSLVFIGSVDGTELGRTYTGYPLEQDGSSNNNSSSPEPMSNKDWRNVIWCVNLDDIKNAANVYDPAYCYMGDFETKWRTVTDSGVEGLIQGISFDQANSKLYVFIGRFSGEIIVERFSVTAKEV